MRKHNLTFFIECLDNEIVETYKHLVGISEEQEKLCSQKWRFFTFFENQYFKTCHRILIIFYPE